MANKTVEEKLISLIQIRERLKSKLQEKGVTIPQNTAFKDYYTFIDQLPDEVIVPEEEELKIIYDLMWYTTLEKLSNEPAETAEINELFNKILGG